MRQIIPAIIGCLILSSAMAAMPATQPVSTEIAKLAFQANEAFDRGQYAAAVPLLEKLAEQVKDQPDRLGLVQEQIRVAKKNIEINATAVQVLPGQSDLDVSAEKRKPHTAPKPGQTETMAIKELGNFEYDADKGGNIPTDVKGLTGASIRLNGFMIPMDQADKITQFALVPSLFACCFGQPPQIQHTIIVTCPKGKAVSYCPDEIIVEGKLKVNEKKEDGFIVSIFEMDCMSVKPAAK